VEERTAANSTTTSENDSTFGVLKLATPRADVFEDGSPVIRKGKGTLPVGTGCKNEEVVVNAFARGQNDGAVTALFALLNSSDATDLDGAVILHQETFVGNENGILEFALGSGGHADGGREMNGEGTGSHEGKGSCTGIDLGGEDAGNGGTSCATTNNYDAFAARHDMDGERSKE
jgi:hypothetical protein